MDDDSDLRPAFVLRLSRGQLIGIDAAVAVTYTFLLITGTGLTTATTPSAIPTWLESLLAAAAVLPVTVRRLWPRAVLTVGLTLSLLLLWLAPAGEVFMGPAFALYIVATTARRRSREPTFAIGGVSVIGAAILTTVGTVDMQDNTIAAALLGVMLMGTGWSIGRAVQERRLLAVRAAEQRAEQAVTEERLRIARELHDIVAHGMSLIAIKAGIANHVLAVRPAEAHDALRVIEATSRDALIEMRHLLGVLRSEPRRDGAPELGPTPSLAGLPELVERAATAGVQVTLDVPADVDLPEGVELTVFRIVQEAVTNVVKHAAPAQCRVTVTVDRGEVAIDVADDGRAPTAGPRTHRVAGNHGGHGLVGMRERVAMYGGTLSAGPRDAGGYRVTVRLPYESSRTRTAPVSGGAP